MEEPMEEPNKITKFLTNLKDITTVDFFTSLLLFFCYFETYIRIKFNIDFIQFSNNPNQYWNYLSDTVFLLLIFSFTISILFDIIREFYWSFLYHLWDKIGINMYLEMKNKEYFAPIFEVKQIAYETNNNILYDMCIKQEKINRNRQRNEKYKNNAVWGILFFTFISLIHFFISDINSLPIIINLLVKIYYILSNSIILSIIFIIPIILSVLWLIIYLSDTLHLKESEFYKTNCIEIGKNNNLAKQIKKSNYSDSNT